jgi:hypothetical protein
VPYWNYHRVREALDAEKKRYHFHGADRRVVEDIARSVRSQDIQLGIDDLEARTRIVDSIMENVLRNSPPVSGEVTQSLRYLIWDICRAEFCQEVTTSILSNKDGQRFFLEPTIAEALSTTSMKGLTTADIPEFPTPLSIFLPEGTPQYLEGDDFQSTITMDAIHVAAPVAGKDVKMQDALAYPMIVNNHARLADDDLVKSQSYAMAMLTLWPNLVLPLEEYLNGTFTTLSPNEKGEVESKLNQSAAQVVVQRLFLNLLFYWKSEDPDILKQLNPEWEKLRQKIHRHVGGKRKRANAQLKKTPKHEHYLVGSHLEILQRRRPVGDGEDSVSEPTGRHLRRHKRRGHWKWQPCGERNMRRKLIFVDTYMTRGLGGPEIEKVGYSVRS